MGVEKQILTPGTGPNPVRGQKVTVHCTGFGKDGNLSKKFWSTKDPGGQPFTFEIGKVEIIEGWDEGVLEHRSLHVNFFLIPYLVIYLSTNPRWFAACLVVNYTVYTL
ncbi:Peptidyl-prolyl cis-trans isomerase FKBP12-like protein [Drosera capensis]